MTECTDQPLVQVPNRAISQWDDGDRAAAKLVPGRLVPSHVPDPGHGQSIKALVRVSVERRARRDMLLDEGVYGGLLEILGTLGVRGQIANLHSEPKGGATDRRTGNEMVNKCSHVRQV
jgi:hypothetical protein